MAAEAAMKNSALSRDQTAEMPLSATPSGTPSGTPSEGGFAKLDPQSRVNRPSDPPQQIIRRDEYWDKDAKCWQLVVPKAQPDSKVALQKHVLLVRRVFDKDMNLSYTEVDISGARLLLVLMNIFRDVHSFPLTAKRRALKPEYLFWAQEDLLTVAEYCKNTDNKETLFQVEAALLFVAEHYTELKDDLSPVSIRSSIAFDNIWAVYAPNTLIRGQDVLEQVRVWRVKHASFQSTLDGKPELNIAVEFHETDGQRVGWATANLKVPSYEGCVLVETLPYVPLHLLHNREQIWAALSQRAEKQLSFLSSAFTVQEHDGECLVYGHPEAPPWEPSEPLRYYSRSRVIIDPIKYRAAEQAPLMPTIVDSGGFSKGITSWNTADGKQVASAVDLLSGNVATDDAELQMDYLQTDSPSTPEALYPPEDPFAFLLPPMPISSTNGVSSKKKGMAETELKDVCKRLSNVDAILFSGLCYGFILLDGRWAAFSASRLSDVEWHKDMLSSLVISAPVMESMRQLVQSHHTRRSFDDFVPGKGKGLVGLLSGQPGLGKTFTAEAIAETAGKPLYSVSSGALGGDANSISTKLRTIMNLCAHWQAVLLLDEADVFLAKREIADLKRNAVVSVFLRELEYYPGILIMTTNLPESIDAAFQSRIHFCHHYPPLEQQARRRIWQQFITKAEASLGTARVNIDDAGLSRLAERDMNGRQIKNAISITITLSGGDKEGKMLTADSILTAAETLQAFNFGC